MVAANLDKAADSVKKTVNSEESSKEIDSGKDAVMAAFDKLMEAKSHFLHAAETSGLDLKHGASDQFMKGREQAQAQIQQYTGQATSFIREKPLTSLGIAFAAGFVVSKLCTKSK
ncbi:MULTISPECIES: hypothetical protein [Pseudomonas]|uniref:hypothetical protein n=1 Tax=Pseudomonas TaxID=286 RepID=UPI00123AAE4F|nr:MULTISPECIES: hypothetical protein [Pseudomonas]QIB49761.1 hypothetical protein G3M63_01005 [Pseudomonas sp. OIL-1]